MAASEEQEINSKLNSMCISQNDSDPGTETQVPELPNELLLQIVRIAAQTSKQNCHNLALVSHLFNDCARRVVYDRLDSLDSVAATQICSLIISKPHDFFTTDAFTKSISFVERVPLSFAKPILARCSSRIIVFSAHSNNTDNPGCYLPFIRSPFLRRLCLIWDDIRCSMPNHHHDYPPKSLYNQIPLKVLTSLTHLIAYTPYKMPNDHLSWVALSMAQPTPNESKKYWNAFQSLTHVAMSGQNIKLIENLARSAWNLKYIVVFVDATTSWDRQTLKNRVHNKEDRRWIMIDKESVADRDLIDSGAQNLFWKRVERLVEVEFLPDSGVGW